MDAKKAGDLVIDLIVDESGSCLPTALNIYFGVRLFDSLADFDSKQSALMGSMRYRNGRLSALDSMAVVRANGRVNGKSLLFTVRQNSPAAYAATIAKLRRSKRKLLIDYLLASRDEQHVECVQFADDGRLRFLRTGKTGGKLPFMPIGMDRYVADAFAARSNSKPAGTKTDIFFQIFVYTQK